MRAAIATVVVVVLVAAGIAAGLLVASREAAEGPIAAPTGVPTTPPPPQVAPLTGVTVPEAGEGSVLAVKVENSAAARPQTGLEAADIVYEELTEGGITRFIALYQSALPETIGPVRSARFVDAEVLPAYEPVLAISGAADPVVEALRSAGVTFVEEGEGFYREPERASPHDLFLRPEEVLARVDSPPPPPSEPVWPFAAEVPEGASSGDEITIAMSDASVTGFVYDPEAGVYRREQDGVPFTVTGEGRVGAANVVVMGVETGRIPGQDSAGDPLVGTEVVGSGRAVVLRDGRRYEAEWSKASADSLPELTDAGGAPLALKPGPTWVLLAPIERLPAPVPTDPPAATPTPGS